MKQSGGATEVTWACEVDTQQAAEGGWACQMSAGHAALFTSKKQESNVSLPDPSVYQLHSTVLTELDWWIFIKGIPPQYPHIRVLSSQDIK